MTDSHGEAHGMRADDVSTIERLIQQGESRLAGRVPLGGGCPKQLRFNISLRIRQMTVHANAPFPYCLHDSHCRNLRGGRPGEGG